MGVSSTGGRAGYWLASIALVLALYSYPSLRSRAELGSTLLPPIFAPDLSLYLNLGNVKTIGEHQVLNPYYHVALPSNGTGLLAFGFAARLFSRFGRLLDGHTWFALLIWNLFWWGLLCVVALWVFERFLPVTPPSILVAGLGLLMLFNFGVLKTLLIAWLHLPSVSGFQSIGLPFMRCFIPIIPVTFVLAYLGLQIEALRRRNLILWMAMGAVQLLGLAVFPYATLMMAGITAVSVLWETVAGVQPRELQVPLLYGISCAVLDGAFVLHGSLDLYGTHSSIIHFQPKLMLHLIGGGWLLLVLLTVATGLSKALPPAVKAPLVGLAATNALLMLGDVIVSPTKILLSHHAAYFLHTTMAILLTFLAAAALASARHKSRAAGGALWVVAAVVFLNGLLLASGTYRGFLPNNLDIVKLSRLQRVWDLKDGDLVIARSQTADDLCGWTVLLSEAPVLFCTDAQMMLTPQQTRDIHRFRQSLYLYLSGKDSAFVEQGISGPDSSSRMYQLGYWAEATTASAEDRMEGVRAIRADLIPWLERVQNHDAAVNVFFRQFRRIIVIDNPRVPTFAAERLASFLKLEGQQNGDDLVLLVYVPR
jgi:hypothetical protein